MRPVRKLAALLAMALAGVGGVAGLAACGSDSGSKKSSTTKTAAAVDTVVHIDSPADGSKVRTRTTKGGRLVVDVALTGTAAPDVTVFIRGGCRPEPCLGRAQASADGTWSATLAVKTTAAVRFLTIDAGPDEVVANGSSVVTVELSGGTQAKAEPAKEPATQQPRAKRDTSTAPKPRALPHAVLVIGDSLAVGFGPPLKSQLSGWDVSVDGRIGRPLEEGMRILSQQSGAPAILAFSLFSNNAPGGISQLEQAIRTTTGRSGGCAVWATLHLPPANGNYDEVNKMLRSLAREPKLALSFQLVDWDEVVTANPGLLAGDGIHGTPAGYATLGQLYAEKIRACAGEGLG